MINKFFTCPYCKKETSYLLEPACKKILLSIYSIGFGCLLKKECDFCKGSLSINWFHYLLSNLILFLLLILVWITSQAIYFHALTDDLKQIGPAIGFALFIPIGLILFYVIFPSIIGMIGLRLYLKRDNPNKETEENKIQNL